MIISFEKNPGVFELHGKWPLLLRAMVNSRMNIIITGGTSSGKTTLLNLLLQEITSSSRIITIEDIHELYFSHKNLVSLNTFSASLKGGLSICDLVKNSLRMRPDRIIIGESRGGEFFDLLMAMNTGHRGSMSTIHANSAADAFSRMEGLFLLSGIDLPLNAIRKHLSLAINFIIHVERNSEGKRVVTHIKEVSGHMEGDHILSSDIATIVEGELKLTGIVSSLRNKLVKEGGLPNNFF